MELGQARDILVGGGDVNLEGLSGSLDFDLASGDVQGDEFVGWDVVPVSRNSAAAELRATRVYVIDGAGSTGSWSDL